MRDMRDVAAHDAAFRLCAELADDRRLSVQLRARAADELHVLVLEEPARRVRGRRDRNDRELDGGVALRTHADDGIRQVLPLPRLRDTESEDQLGVIEPVVAEEPVPGIRTVDRAVDGVEVSVALDT